MSSRSCFCSEHTALREVNDSNVFHVNKALTALLHNVQAAKRKSQSSGTSRGFLSSLSNACYEFSRATEECEYCWMAKMLNDQYTLQLVLIGAWIEKKLGGTMPDKVLLKFTECLLKNGFFLDDVIPLLWREIPLDEEIILRAKSDDVLAAWFSNECGKISNIILQSC